LPSVEKRAPEWSHNATIYEVNLRQYSEAGTFADFEQHLPRLKEMGVKIVWLMPIHPIGGKNRKGSLGSYYSVKDYTAVNPEHGDLDDLKRLVRRVHEMDMYLILDWVANHTAWDHPWVDDHPDWYSRDEEGNMMPPVPDWSDVVDLDYDNHDMRAAMIEALQFWVREADVDGYRCDVAGMVPPDFWRAARAELDKIKPVFMLAEWDEPELHEAFDMTYSWGFHHLMNAVAKGEKNADDIESFFASDAQKYSGEAFRMQFTSNHDENAWNGTVFERLGDGAATFAVLAATVPGMPLVYSGQEAGLVERLAFFDKDVIEWREHAFFDMYEVLMNLNQTNRALWNGSFGGEARWLSSANTSSILAFTREKDGDKVLAVFNLSRAQVRTTVEGASLRGTYTEILRDESSNLSFGESVQMTLEPWEYRVYVKE
jgi:glycosidase